MLVHVGDTVHSAVRLYTQRSQSPKSHPSPVQILALRPLNCRLASYLLTAWTLSVHHSIDAELGGGMVKQGSDGSKKQCRAGKTWWQGRTGWKPGWNLICLWICSGRERRTIMTPIKRSPKVETRKVIQSFHLPSLKCCSRIEVAIFTVATWLSNWQVHNFDATF